MTSLSKYVHIKKSDDIVNECNNKYHRTIKMKPVDTYIDSMELHPTELHSNKDPKFKLSDHVRISKIFLLKDTHQTGPKKFS